MLGKASEIKVKQITRAPLFSFDYEEHRKHLSLPELLEKWLSLHSNFSILSISFLNIDKTEIANIVYKEV